MSDPKKWNFTLIPAGVLEYVCNAMQEGADKYGRDEWKKLPPEAFISALIRHLEEIRTNVNVNLKVVHASYLASNALILLSLYKNESEKRDA